jgi:hypothetical protein
LECAEIRNGFIAGRVPAGPEVEAHLKWCPHCRELFEKGAALGRRLAQAVLPEAEPGDLFALVDREVNRETGLRARLRALPTRVRASAMIGVALALVGWQVLFHLSSNSGGPGPNYSPALFWLLAAALVTLFGAGAYWLLRGALAPVRSEASTRLGALALLVAPTLAALLTPLGTGSPELLAALGHPSACFVYGAALVVPVVALYWLFERRDRVPWTALVTVGALAGIAANLLLQAHCPSKHLGHLLLGHASIGVAWALGLSLLSKPFQRLG